MARRRSREAESRLVNRRLLGPGAVGPDQLGNQVVRNRHLWPESVDRTILAPRSVLEHHLDPEVSERFQAGWQVTLIADTTIPDGGGYFEFDTVESSHGVTVTVPTAELVVPQDCVCSVQHLYVEWSNVDNDAAWKGHGAWAEVRVNGVQVAPRFEAGADGLSYSRLGPLPGPKMTLKQGDVVTVHVFQNSGSGQALTGRLSLGMEDPTQSEPLPPAGVHPDPPHAYFISIARDGSSGDLDGQLWVHRKTSDVGGNGTLLANPKVLGTTHSQFFAIRARIDGGRIRAKTWQWGTTEPDWQVDVVDEDPLGPGYTGVGVSVTTFMASEAWQDTLEVVGSGSTNYSGYPLGEVDWPQVFAFSTSNKIWTIQDAGGWTGERRIRHNDLATDRSWVLWEDGGSHLDMEVLARVWVPAGILRHGILLRGAV